MTQQRPARKQVTPSEAGAPGQYFRLLAEAIPQAVWTANADGGVDYFNRRWSEYTGLPLAGTQAWSWHSLLHPADLQSCLDHWNEALRTGQSYETEYRLKRVSDGCYRWPT